VAEAWCCVAISAKNRAIPRIYCCPKATQPWQGNVFVTPPGFALVHFKTELAGGFPAACVTSAGRAGKTKTDFVGVSKFITGLAVAAALLAPVSAQAGEQHTIFSTRLTDKVTGVTHDVISFLGFGGDQRQNPTDPQPIEIAPRAPLAAREMAPVAAVGAVATPALPARPAPSVETPLHRLFCVEYARARSGLAVFGDAKHWWERARNLYARLSHPVEEAVMVFSGSKRLRRGHVAVVTEIISPREIIVDQANWQNHGEIDHATPVLDVSKDNDWSLVRVWDIPSGTFGARTYPISGFIAKNLTRQAATY
jgi:hypothetical protein